MADQILVDNGAETDYTVSTDDCGAAGHAQRVKLAYSADGTATHVTADADGLLVNLGANNDITGTVDLGATDNAVLDAIAASLALIDNSIAAGNELQVDVVAALPAGANLIGSVDLGATDNAVLDAIAASVAAIDTDSTTIIGHLDGVETVLGTIDADTGGILTAVQLIDDAVQVLGTDTYTETTSKGITLGAVRRDADTTLAGTTNEFAPLQVDANGRLKVEAFSGEALPVTLTSTTVTGTVAVTQSGTWDEVGINDSGNSITVDNGGTFVTQIDGAALTSLQLADDVVVVLGTATYTEATSSANAIGAVRRDADTTLVNTTNEWGPLQMDANGRLKVEAFSGETLPVSGTVTETNSGTALTALQLIDDPVATLGTTTYTETTTKGMIVGAVRRDADTTLVDTTNEIGPLQMNAAGQLKVEVFTGETLPVSLAALPASTNTLEVVGDAAHDAALAGNPVRIGARGVSTDPTVITTGRTVDLLASLLGKQIMLQYCHPGASKSYASPAAVADTSDDEAFAAIASTRTYVTGVQVFNADATVGTEVVIKDGSTVLWRGYAAALGGGCSARFDPPLRGTANTAVNVANITTSAETYFNLQGYSATE